MSFLRWESASFLCWKFREVIDMKEKAEKYHGDMVATLNLAEKEEWDKEIEKAEVDRIQDYKAMDIMKTQDIARPTAIDTRDTAIAEGRDVNEEWMWLALMIKEEQIAGWERLASQITILSTLQGEARPPGEPDPTAFDNVDGNDGEDNNGGEVELGTAPESKVIALPSSSQPLVSTLRSLELMLWVEQANCYLQNLRAVIAEKLFLYTHVICAKTIKAVMTQAWGVIAELNFKMTGICRSYSCGQAALVALVAPNEVLEKYCKLHKTDTKSSTVLLTPNITGSTTLKLSWIWLVDSLTPGDSPELLCECE
ncbi:hypothetical protein DXG01_015850 [Tephrocybe rancida]|nr:hypothetical protein DXG01_015850 [Tephrocybe rancida]